jgi:very-short-patch-repair endonuclease
LVQRKQRLDLQMLARARELRARSSDAERRLWQLLRARSLGGLKFRRQQVVGRFVVDFYCAASRLAVELDGGQHADASARAYDARREAELCAAGLRVVRFWNDQVLREPEAVALAILEAARGRDC